MDGVMAGAVGRTLAVVSLGLLLSNGSAAATETGSIAGRLRMGVEGLTLADAGAIVVFLEAESAPSSTPSASLAPAQVRQVGARFEPDFLVVARGQAVEMPNDDVIFHNVFSYSKPNDFDLGMYAAGESRMIRFEYPGLVRIYCSIHDEMDGLIFVAPSPSFARPDSTGGYSLPGVANGRYRLHVWSERLPELVAPVEIRGGEESKHDWVLGVTAEDVD